MTGRDKFKKIRGLLIFGTSILKLFPNFILTFMWDCTSRYSQLPFIGVRYMLIKAMAKKCGNNVRIGTNVRILNPSLLILGNNVSIHDNCYIDAAGEISIGNEVSIAHSCSILSTNHAWDSIDTPIKYIPTIPSPVTIKDDVWLGCAVRVLAGVTVSSRSIIAAGAVVNKNIESNSINGGVPARKIKDI